MICDDSKKTRCRELDLVRFVITVKSAAPMAWKPNAVQLRSLKYSNVASYVTAKALGESEALEVVPWLL